MVTTVDEYNKQLKYVIEDLKANLNFTYSYSPPHFQTYNMDKPIYVMTKNTEKYTGKLEDKGDHYEMLFPRFGSLQKSYTNDFCWILDEHTVFIIERPFKNRVMNLLKRLLPDVQLRTIKNDVMINEYKIGPTCVAGRIHDFTGEKTSDYSSMIYCLRWDNVEGLDKYFAGDPNHEARKNGTKNPLGCLKQFLPNMTREEFMSLLEKEN